MPKIERFEDLRGWKKAREMTSEVYDLTESSDLSGDYRLRDQLTGAAVSTMSNISEGFARYHKKDFIRFLDYAQSSAAEVKSLLYVALDQNYGGSERIKDLQRQSEASQRMIRSLLKHVRSSISESTPGRASPIQRTTLAKAQRPPGHCRPSSSSHRPTESNQPSLSASASQHQSTPTPKHPNTKTPVR